MLKTLIDEAHVRYLEAIDKAEETYKAFMLTPCGGKEDEREAAMNAAWREMNHAHGVLEGLELAQRYLSAQERCSA